MSMQDWARDEPQAREFARGFIIDIPDDDSDTGDDDEAAASSTSSGSPQLPRPSKTPQAYYAPTKQETEEGVRCVLVKSFASG